MMSNVCRRIAPKRLLGVFACAGIALLVLSGQVQAQVQRTMVNAGFESPVMDSTSDNVGCIRILVDTAVPGWITTDPSRSGNNTTTCQGAAIPGTTSVGRPIEFWSSGSGGFRSRAGNQFVELNAWTASRLRQDVCMLSGETVNWSVSHRGRLSATVADVMEFRIGTTTIARMSTTNTGAGSVSPSFPGSTASYALGPNGWADYSGQFVYPGTSGISDLGFEAISAAGGSPSAGNFLDNIQVYLRPFVEFSSSGFSMNETNPTLNVPKLAVAGTVPAGGMSVPVTITGGTATAGVDYTTPGNATTFSVFIPAGTYDYTTFNLPITVINDGEVEPNETITISSPATTPVDPYILSSLNSCGAPAQSTTTASLVDAPVPLPRVQLNKALSANRVAVSDQFTLRIQGSNGVQTTTTGSGSTVNNGSIQVAPAAAGTAYTLSEVMAAGSSSLLAAYTTTISCTNTTPNSATVLPSGPGTSFSVTPVTGDNISCTLTNDVATAPAFIDVDKTVTSGQIYDSVGDVATYSYVVRNTGLVAVDTLTVTDNKIASVNCGGQTTLAVGASVTCTGSYTVTQADIDATLVTNIVQASARSTVTGQVAVDTDDAVINAALPSLTLDKSANTASFATVGQVVSYTYVVANTGNVTINNLQVTDDKVATVSCPVTTLAPNANTTCTGSYTITQADMDAGTLTNIARTSATPAFGTLSPAADSATVTGPAAAASMTLDKTASGGVPFDAAGDVVTYQYVVANTGNVTIRLLAVTDDKIATVTCPVNTLAPGVSTTCTASYTVTQADLDAGSVTNNATATATASRGTLSAATDNVTASATPAPALSLAKSVTSGAPYDSAGDVVDYAYLVTNTGNVTINALAVTDDKIATVTCPVNTLAPGASTTCTANYTIVQADLDAGSVTNTATANGTPAQGTLTPATDSATANATVAPSLSLAKSVVTGAPYDSVGDVIAYAYLVTNTGNVTLGSPQVTDDRIASVNCGGVSTLAPGANMSCTGSYTVTQADLDAGSVTNTASAHATSPPGSTLTSPPDSVTVNVAAAAALSLVKTVVSGASYDSVGDVIGYQYAVTNTGNVTINALAVTDDKIATVNCPLTTLAPGASTTCTGSYTILQADLDTGSVTNNASASGTPAQGTLTPATDSETVTATALPSLTLDKNVVLGSPYSSPGDEVDYTYLVTNTGNVTINALAVTDNKIATVTCPVNTLAPGASTTCAGSYIIDQDDIDNGSVTNDAVANGTPTQGSLTPATDSATATSDATPALTLAKSAISGAPYDAAGDVITYSYVVANVGAVTINGLLVTDDKTGPVDCGGVTTLDVDAPPITCTADYIVTQADLDAGSVTNHATATGTPASGTLVDGTDEVTVDADVNAALTVAKTAVSGVPYDSAGDVIEYEYVVTNDGNVTLTLLSVSDDRIATVTCPVTTLAPDEITTCTASYTVTQADIDAGSVTNQATATAQSPQGTTLSPGTGVVTVGVAASPAMTLSKTAVSGAPYDSLGDVIGYQYALTNTGNVTINSLTVTDDKIATVNCPSTPLAPGEVAICTASYVITQADLDAGLVTNNATAAGTPTQGTLADANASATVNATALPSMTLAKSVVSGAPYDSAGDVIAYQYRVTNTGNVTINALAVTDDKIATVNCPTNTLAPGMSTTCTASYTIIQADLDAGSVTNHASANGSTNQGPLAPVNDSATVNATALPSMTLAKSAVSGAPYDSVGGVVGYQYVVRNTGNVTINALAVSDDKIATVNCPPAPLAPGASTTCTANYTITQADIDAGAVTNNASASGSTSQGSLAPATASATVLSDATPALSLAKSAVSGAPYDSAGDVIDYQYLITNTGDVTINPPLTVTDDKIATVDCPATALAPGASATCTASYTTTQADLDAGSVTNNATASGIPASGVLTPATDDATATATQAPGLTLAKTIASGSPYDSVGDVIAYQYVVTNSGNTTITASISVADDKTTVACDALPSGGLAPQATLNCTASYTATQADLDAGSVTNTASATDGTTTSPTVTATATASALPALMLDKSAISGVPYDSVGDVIGYQYLVTNTGNVTINVLTVTDDKIATVNCPLTTLAPGASTTCTASYTIVQADLDAGSVTNTATATATPTQGTLAPATDSETVAAAPVVTYGKSANVAGPVAAGDRITYTLTVTVANAPTTSEVTLTDTPGAGLVYDALVSATGFACVAGPVCTLPTGTAPGTYRVVYNARVDSTASGTVTNTVTASGGSSLSEATCSGTCAVALSVATPIVDISKSANPASGTTVNTGDTIDYTLTATVNRAATLGDVVLTDTPGPGLVIGAMPAGCTYSGSVIVCTLPAGAPVGVHAFTYPATVADNAGTSVVNTVTATASGNQPAPTCVSCTTTHPLEPANLRVVKDVAVRTIRIGDLVRYTLTVQALGARNVIGGTVIVDTPPAGFAYVEGSLRVVDGDNHATVTGQAPIRFEGIDLAAGQTATLTYLMRVGAGVRAGTQTNQAQAFLPNGEVASSVATAHVELVADPLVDDSLVFGTVFDDRDGDGWQDEGDAGIPGVRIASLEGLLIETDQFGRYHLTGIPGGVERGRNFLLKVDPSTLPAGTAFSTDNPLQRRITPGLPVRFDWGVKLPAQAAAGNGAAAVLALSPAFFAAGGIEVREQYQPVIDTMAATLREHGGGDVVIEAAGDAQALAFDRAGAVRAALVATLEPAMARAVTVSVREQAEVPASLVAGVDAGGARLGSVLFEPGTAIVRSGFEPLLDRVAATLERRAGGTVTLVGTAEDSGLGLRRAQAVYDALAPRLSPPLRAKVQVEAPAATAAADVQRLQGGRP